MSETKDALSPEVEEAVRETREALWGAPVSGDYAPWLVSGEQLVALRALASRVAEITREEERDANQPRHVLTHFYDANGHAEIAVKCTHDFNVWAGNLPLYPRPLEYYSPDEAAAIRRGRGSER